MEKEKKYTQLSIYDFLDEKENEKVYENSEEMIKKIEVLETRFSLVKDPKVLDATNQLITILKNRLKKIKEVSENE